MAFIALKGCNESRLFLASPCFSSGIRGFLADTQRIRQVLAAPLPTLGWDDSHTAAREASAITRGIPRNPNRFGLATLASPLLAPLAASAGDGTARCTLKCTFHPLTPAAPLRGRRPVIAPSPGTSSSTSTRRIGDGLRPPLLGRLHRDRDDDPPSFTARVCAHERRRRLVAAVSRLRERWLAAGRAGRG